jgi:peptidyl-prolyl cis-trans isomerase C
MLLVSGAYAQDKPTAATVLATVNGTDITVGHVIALTSRLPERFQALDDADLYQGVMEQLIQQTALANKVDSNRNSIRIALENEKRALLATETLNKIEAEATTEPLIEAAYAEKYTNVPAQIEYKASHILVETEDQAKELIKTLEGGADFAELAKEKSTGPSAPSGGDLGWIAKGRTVPEFETALVVLKPGEISGPVKTQFGWHVIKLAETRDTPKPPLVEVRAELIGQLKTKAVAAYLQTLEETSDIKRLDIEIDPAIIRDTQLLDQ